MTEPESPNRIVFFSRCRPQYSDPIDLVLREKRVFIGYPAWREGIEPRRGHLRESIVDLRCSDDEWSVLYPQFGKDRKQYQQNRNFFRLVEPGAIALVPRPDRGVVYAGRVVRGFELLDDPPWGDDYLRIRVEQGLDIGDEFSHLGDVAQCCQVDRFQPIPFPVIPAWLRRSLLGRSTYGRVVPPIQELGLEPYSLLDRLLDNPSRPTPPWTDNIPEVEHRLIDAVGPNTFEHLCVALLQLEYPDDIWIHVGGSGDGGVDGIGAGPDGRAVALLQCKWAYWGQELDRPSQGGLRWVLAALLHPKDVYPRGADVEFWTRTRIASLVTKHSARLPLAISLRIKKAQKLN